MKVNDIFNSIQGEGPFAGQVARFIRLSGCNLECSWCDTNHEHGVDMKIDLSELIGHLLVITGGEPLLQKDEVIELCYLAHKSGMNVQIETNGTIYTDLPEFVHLVISPKHNHAIEAISKFIDRHTKTYLKYVIGPDAFDLTTALMQSSLYRYNGILYLQSQDGNIEIEKKIAWDLLDRPFAKISIVPRLHQLWGLK